MLVNQPLVVLTNFKIGDFFIVALEYFHVGEKRCLRWRGSGGVKQAINDNVCLVEDLRIGQLPEEHGTR